MKAIVAIVFAMVGVMIGLFIWLRWNVAAKVTPVTISWERPTTRPVIERKAFTAAGVDFNQARQRHEDHRELALLRRGDEIAVLPDVVEIHFVESDGTNVWAVAEDTTEGPGPSLLVIRSTDGVNFQGWMLEKPTYLAEIRDFRMNGDSAELTGTIDPLMFLTDSWWNELMLALPSAVRPLAQAETFSFRTRDGGKTWRLSR